MSDIAVPREKNFWEQNLVPYFTMKSLKTEMAMIISLFQCFPFLYNMNLNKDWFSCDEEKN